MSIALLTGEGLLREKEWKCAEVLLAVRDCKSLITLERRVSPLDTSGCLIRRKAELVAAVRGGRWSLEGARERYASTIDEFLSWQTTLDPHGLPGQAGRQNPPLQFLLL